MNIIELAREADLTFMGADAHCREDYFTATREELERFANLIRAAALEEAAGVCDDKHDEWRFGDGEDSTSGPKDCAVAIRQLKDKT